MAWIQGNIKFQNKEIAVQKNKSSDEFNMPIDLKIKEGDTFEFDNASYKAMLCLNSRDEFLLVSASADEKKTQPEGNIEDDGEKPQSI